MNNLPPELVDRINKKANRNSMAFLSETSSGGFVPYSSMTKRATSVGATSMPKSNSVVHVSETSHWLTRNEV